MAAPHEPCAPSQVDGMGAAVHVDTSSPSDVDVRVESQGIAIAAPTVAVRNV